MVKAVIRQRVTTKSRVQFLASQCEIFKAALGQDFLWVLHPTYVSITPPILQVQFHSSTIDCTQPSQQTAH